MPATPEQMQNAYAKYGLGEIKSAGQAPSAQAGGNPFASSSPTPDIGMGSSGGQSGGGGAQQGGGLSDLYGSENRELQSNLAKRGQNIVQDFRAGVNESNPLKQAGEGFAAGGQVLGGGLDIVNNLIQRIPGAKSVMGAVGGEVKNMKDAANLISGGALDKAGAAYKGLLEKHPLFAKDLEALGNAAQVATLAGGGPEAAQAASEAAVPAVESAAAKIGEIGGATKGSVAGLSEKMAPLAEKLAGKAPNTLDLISPIADKGSTLSALKAGSKGVEESSLWEAGKVRPSNYFQKVADTVDPIMGKSASNIERIDKLNAAVKDISENVVKQHLDAHPALYNENLLKSKFNGLLDQMPKSFKTDPQLTKTYQGVIDTALDVAKGQPTKDMSGLWDSRKQFDTLVKREFGDKALTPQAMGVRDQAIRDVRGAMNDFISEHTDNSTFKNSMEKLNHIYSARDNIAEKALQGKEITRSKFAQFLKNHPTAVKVAKIAAPAVIGGEVIKHFLP